MSARNVTVAMLLVLVVLGTWSFLNPAWELPPNIATYGHKIDNLYYQILWITGIAFLVTHLVLIYSLLRFGHKGEGTKAHYSHGHHHLETGWTVATGLMLLWVAVVQAQTWNEIKVQEPTAEDMFEVQVFAKQFEWNFRYKGADGQFGTSDDLYSTTELHVPKDRVVRLYLRSLDVLHSLFLINLRVKQDLVPGTTTRVWFNAMQTTDEARAKYGEKFDFEIACAELCGIGHHAMRGKVKVHSKESFAAWQKGRIAEQEEVDMSGVTNLWNGKPEGYSVSFWEYAGTIKPPRAEATH
ncbi:MAG: cytochrome c oxidase subunit II [Planctomycetota bacterium]|nr:cytochrome c oxidase subunit II [Planctomycetota bacterium]